MMSPAEIMSPAPCMSPAAWPTDEPASPGEQSDILASSDTKLQRVAQLLEEAERREAAESSEAQTLEAQRTQELTEQAAELERMIEGSSPAVLASPAEGVEETGGNASTLALAVESWDAEGSAGADAEVDTPMPSPILADDEVGTPQAPADSPQDLCQVDGREATATGAVVAESSRAEVSDISGIVAGECYEQPQGPPPGFGPLDDFQGVGDSFASEPVEADAEPEAAVEALLEAEAGLSGQADTDGATVEVEDGGVIDDSEDEPAAGVSKESNPLLQRRLLNPQSKAPPAEPPVQSPPPTPTPASSPATSTPAPAEEEERMRAQYLSLLEQAADQRRALDETLAEIKRIEATLGLGSDTSVAVNGVASHPAKRP